MGGWAEEVFWSMFQIGQMLDQMKCSSSLVIESYLRAHKYRPHRIEPIYYLAEILNREGRYAEAYAYIKAYEAVPQPADRDWLSNLPWIDNYGLLDQLSICSYYLGKYQESVDACNKALKIKTMPEEWKNRIKKNRLYSLDKLKKK
jgi:tetratricopeptide (TPR) repeat protein